MKNEVVYTPCRLWSLQELGSPLFISGRYNKHYPSKTLDSVYGQRSSCFI